MASENLPSSSDEHTDNVNVSQLKVLSLNYLRNRNMSEIPDAKNIPKLNPCHICERDILTHPPQAFTILACDHILHRTCLEKHIIRAESRSPKCPVCPTYIEIIREELAHASGEFHLVRKDHDSVKKASQVSTDTIENDDNDLEYMRELGLAVDDSSLAGQEKQTDKLSVQDQATNPIAIEDSSTTQEDSENQTNENEENQTNANNGNDTVITSSSLSKRTNVLEEGTLTKKPPMQKFIMR